MQRRTFLGACAGLFGLPWLRRTGEVVCDELHKPRPRWEWEVGWWTACYEQQGDVVVETGNVREWKATVTLCDREWEDIAYSDKAFNDATFLGAFPGYLQFVRFDCTRLSDGLWDGTVTLREYRRAADRMCVQVDDVTWNYQVYKRIDFYDLFRGEHAVVGGEVA